MKANKPGQFTKEVKRTKEKAKVSDNDIVFLAGLGLGLLSQLLF